MRIASGSQGTAEWLHSRTGKVTASRIKDVMNVLKNGTEGAGRRKYKRELALERLTGLTATHYVTPAMEHGIAYEPIARSAYEMEKRDMVETVGFVLHPTLDFTGASPDGIIKPNGGLEIKSPQEDTIVEWIRSGLVVPEDHQEQCLWVMECCELEWLDFMAGHPRFRPFIVRMPRDDKRLDAIRDQVCQFHEEVNALVEELRPWVISSSVIASGDESPMPDDIASWASAFDEFMQGDVTP